MRAMTMLGRAEEKVSHFTFIHNNSTPNILVQRFDEEENNCRK